MFTINFFHPSIVTSINEIEQTVGFIRKAFHFKISRQDKIKHSEMGQEHLIKIITHSWRVGAKIMKQSQCSTLTFLLICPLGNQVPSFSCPCVCFDCPPPSKHPSCIHCPNNSINTHKKMFNVYFVNSVRF